MTNGATYLKFMEAYNKIQEKFSCNPGNGKTAAMAAALRLMAEEDNRRANKNV